MEVTIKSRSKRRPLFLPEDFTENKVRLIRGGREYFDLLKTMIGKAKETVHLQTYIYDDDKTGRDIAYALIKAARRNVKVYLLVDGYASKFLSQSIINDLRKGGVNFRFFEPIFRSKYFYFGRRLHHKMMVVDGKYAIVGGINIANRYNVRDGQPAWLDFALYVEGDIAKELCVLGYKTWKGFPNVMGITPCEEKKIDFNIDTDEKGFVRMRRNDWVRRKNQISSSYIAMLSNAKNEILFYAVTFCQDMNFSTT